MSNRLVSLSPNVLRKFYIVQYSMNHTCNMLMWTINWLLLRIHSVAPFIYYSIHTFSGTRSPPLTESCPSRKEQTASICDWQGNSQASSSAESHFPEMLSHLCLALGCLHIICWEAKSWNVNLALKDNMLLKSDKKEKLSWVQTDCLCSQVLKMHSQKYFL